MNTFQLQFMLIFFMIFGLSRLNQQSFAQTASVTKSGYSSPFGHDRFGFEVKPYQVIMGSVPGVGTNSVGSVGASVEWLLSPQFALHADSFLIDSNLLIASAGEKTKDLTLNSLNGYSIEVGGRYYSAPESSCWYGGAKIGFMDLNGKYDYQERSGVEGKSNALTPGVEGGYRWFLGWQQDMMVRLGVLVSGNAVQSRKRDLGPFSATTEENKITEQLNDQIDTATYANVDLGVGYWF